MALKDLAKNAVEMNEEAIEMVTGGYTLPEDVQWQDGELRCQYCDIRFPYTIIITDSRTDEHEKKRAEVMLAQHVIEYHRGSRI